jgi:hypothetical protein
MVVENLSMSGIGFRTSMQQSIKAGDMLTVKFVLDNKSRTEIAKDIVVKIVIGQMTGLVIGGEFCDINAFYKELAGYLRPT